MKRVAIIVFILCAVFLFYYRKYPLISKVRIGTNVIVVEVAVTERQKQLGLGGRERLEFGHGMLFLYDHKEQYEFWMRGMRFPLDIIWIDEDTVADIVTHVPPPKSGENPVIVKPNFGVDTVLEVPAGTVDRLDITIGDRVEFLDR